MRDIWPTFDEILTLAILFILNDSDLIFGMYVPYDKTFAATP